MGLFLKLAFIALLSSAAAGVTAPRIGEDDSNYFNNELIRNRREGVPASGGGALSSAKSVGLVGYGLSAISGVCLVCYTAYRYADKRAKDKAEDEAANTASRLNNNKDDYDDLIIEAGVCENPPAGNATTVSSVNTSALSSTDSSSSSTPEAVDQKEEVNRG